MTFSAVVGKYFQLLGNGKTLTGIFRFTEHLDLDREAVGITNVGIWGYPDWLQSRIQYQFAFFEIKRAVMQNWGKHIVVLIDQAERFFDNRLCMGRSSIFNNYFLGLTRKANVDLVATIDDFGRFDVIIRGDEDHPGYCKIIDIPTIYKDNKVRVKRKIKGRGKVKVWGYEGDKVFGHYDTLQSKFSDRDLELGAVARDIVQGQGKITFKGIIANTTTKQLQRRDLHRWIRWNYSIGMEDARDVENMVRLIACGILTLSDLGVGGGAAMPPENRRRDGVAKHEVSVHQDLVHESSS